MGALSLDPTGDFRPQTMPVCRRGTWGGGRNPLSWSLVIMLSFTLLAMLASSTFWSFYCKIWTSEYSKWLIATSGFLTVHQIPRSARFPNWFKGGGVLATSKGRGGEEWEEEGKGREGKGKGKGRRLRKGRKVRGWEGKGRGAGGDRRGKGKERKGGEETAPLRKFLALQWA